MSKRSAYRKKPQADVACSPCLKVKENDIVGLEKEAQDRISFDNKNIDPERTRMNLFVHGFDKDGLPVINKEKYSVPLKDRIFNRIREAGAIVRKDKDQKILENNAFVPKGKNTKESVVAEAMEFQFSHRLAMQLLNEDGMLDSEGRMRKDRDLPVDGKTFRAFADTYNWICERYGKENVVGAYIHLDEYTPHMHVFVVPITIKTKKYKKKILYDESGNPITRGVLDAKNLFSPKTIKQLWSDYAEAMKDYGATAAKGLAPKGAYDKAASIDAMIEQNEETIIDQESEIKEQQETLNNLEKERQNTQKLIDDLREEENQARKRRDDYEAEAKESEEKAASAQIVLAGLQREKQEMEEWMAKADTLRDLFDPNVAPGSKLKILMNLRGMPQKIFLKNMPFPEGWDSPVITRFDEDLVKGHGKYHGKRTNWEARPDGSFSWSTMTDGTGNLYKPNKEKINSKQAFDLAFGTPELQDSLLEAINLLAKNEKGTDMSKRSGKGLL